MRIAIRAQMRKLGLRSIWVSCIASLALALPVGLGFRVVAAEAPPNPMPANWQDPLFTEPFVDIDEWRDTPVRHRYVHGGFRGTDLLFSR